MLQKVRGLLVVFEQLAHGRVFAIIRVPRSISEALNGGGFVEDMWSGLIEDDSIYFLLLSVNVFILRVRRVVDMGEVS